MLNRLILVPTPLERGIIVDAWNEFGDCPEQDIRLCGFGPIAAAARATQLITEIRPSEVTLLGIAGALSDYCEIGSAVDFATVVCDGVGVGTGDDFQPAVQLGWSQRISKEGQLILGDRIQSLLSAGHCELLSVCAASANPGQAAARKKRFPEAVAEDMEGFGVALSCELLGVPLRIIRGISNYAGDRSQANWRIRASLCAAVAQIRGQI